MSPQKAPKTMKNQGFGQLTTRLFSIKASKNVGFGAHGVSELHLDDEKRSLGWKKLDRGLKFWLELQVTSVEHPFGEANKNCLVSAAGGWGSEEQISWIRQLLVKDQVPVVKVSWKSISSSK